MNYQVTSPIGQTIELPFRHNEAVGHSLRQLAFGDWNPAQGSSQRAYET